MPAPRVVGPVGSEWLLRRLPPVVVGVGVAAFSFGAVGAMRARFEGRYYDHSLASRPGDSMVAGYLALVSHALRTQEPATDAQPPSWHVGVGIAASCAALGLHLRALAQNGGRETAANKYHNLVVVPTLTYAVASTLPTVWRLRSARQRTAAMALLLGWGALLGHDLKHGNLRRNSQAGCAADTP